MMNAEKPKIRELVDTTDWSFLRRREWIGYFALVISFSILCVFLAMWQMDRRTEILTKNEHVMLNWDREVSPIEDVQLPEDTFDAENTWRQVSLEGHYLLDEQVLARVRPLNGKPGFEILTPFETTNGVLLVNRGWIPKGFSQDYPDEVPDAPEGQSTVVVRMRPAEPKLEHRSAPEGQTASIYPPEIFEKAKLTGYTDVYGALVSEQPSAEHGVLAAKPELTEGPHLGYSLQWYVFGLLAYIALGYFIYTEAPRHPKSEKSGQSATPSRQSVQKGARPTQKQRYVRKQQVKHDSDEAYEDGLL